MKGQLRIYYDEEGDFLEIRIGESRSNYGEERSDDITIFRDTETDEVVGIGILNFKRRTNLHSLKVNLPVDVGLFAKILE